MDLLSAEWPRRAAACEFAVRPRFAEEISFGEGEATFSRKLPPSREPRAPLAPDAETSRRVEASTGAEMSPKVSSRKSTAKKTTAARITAKKAAPKRATTPRGKGPAEKNLDIYGSAPLLWSRALKQLEAGTAASYWLATTKPDRRPHVAAVGAPWVDGKIYFTSSAKAGKGRNLSENPNCVLSVTLKGLDLDLEGSAVRITDRPTLLRLAQRYAAQGWPASVSGEALTAKYSAPSAGPPPWNLYVVRPTTAFGVATAAPWGATRWRFEPRGGDQT